MLSIKVPASEKYDEARNLFIYTRDYTLQLEHSLVSISKWEAKWCKPFLSKNEKTEEEILDYIRCMTLTQNVPDDVYLALSSENIEAIKNYISAPMTATTFSNVNTPPSREVLTAELIYYWMIYFNIPFECRKWHINTLLTLIRVCTIKNAPSKKMSTKELHARNTSLNQARRAALHSTG